MTESDWNSCTDPQPMLEFLRGKASDRKLRLFACACCRRVWHLLTDERSRTAVEATEQYAERHISRRHLKATADDAERAAVDLEQKETALFQQAPRIPISDLTPEERAGSLILFQKSTTVMSFDETYHLTETQLAAARGAFRCANLESATSDFVALAMADDQTLGTMTKGGCTVSRIPARAWQETFDVFLKHAKCGQCLLLRDISGNPFLPIAVSADSAWLTLTVVSLAQAIYDERAFDRMPILADSLEESGCNDTTILEHCRSSGEHVRGCWVVDLVLGKE